MSFSLRSFLLHTFWYKSSIYHQEAGTNSACQSGKLRWEHASPTLAPGYQTALSSRPDIHLNILLHTHTANIFILKGISLFLKCITRHNFLNVFSIDQFRHIKLQPKTIDLRTRLWGISPTNSVVFYPEPLTEVYGFRLNFNISNFFPTARHCLRNADLLSTLKSKCKFSTCSTGLECYQKKLHILNLIKWARLFISQGHFHSVNKHETRIII